MAVKEILVCEGLCAGYGAIDVLHGLTLKVFAGEMVSVIGANGAGKTTALMCISAIHRIRHGRILFDGHEVQNLQGHELPALGMAQVPEGRKIFPRLTVQENLELGAFTRSDPAEIKQNFERVFELFPVLAERRTQSGGTLSGGEQQMLAIGRALMSNPRMLLLDEPSMGVAPILVTRIFETISALNRQGMTILLVEQNANLALKISTRAYVLETGKVILEGNSAELLKDPRVQESYLGQ